MHLFALQVKAWPPPTPGCPGSIRFRLLGADLALPLLGPPSRWSDPALMLCIPGLPDLLLLLVHWLLGPRLSTFTGSPSSACICPRPDEHPAKSWGVVPWQPQTGVPSSPGQRHSGVNPEIKQLCVCQMRPLLSPILICFPWNDTV